MKRLAPLLLSLAACSASRPSDAVVADKEIETTIYWTIRHYDFEPGLRDCPIRIDCKAGVVELSGIVKTKSEAECIERIARDVSGVREVKNLLVVRP